MVTKFCSCFWLQHHTWLYPCKSWLLHSVTFMWNQTTSVACEVALQYVLGHNGASGWKTKQKNLCQFHKDQSQKYEQRLFYSAQGQRGIPDYSFVTAHHCHHVVFQCYYNDVLKLDIRPISRARHMLVTSYSGHEIGLKHYVKRSFLQHFLRKTMWPLKMIFLCQGFQDDYGNL